MARSIAANAASSSRNRGVLMLAILFGIVSALLMYAFLSNNGGNNDVDKALNSGVGAETVVVATQEIQVGQQISSDMLTTRTIPAGALLEGRYTESKDIVGKVATTPMFPGEQVVAAKITTYEGQTTLAYKIPTGLRALGLMVPHEGWIVGGLVQPGDRVDILGVTPGMSGIIAQDVEVLAVSQSLVKFIPNLDQKAAENGETASPTQPGAAPAPDSKEEDSTYEKAISITLALTPELAAKVALIDAMKDDDAQYRIIPRQKGDTAVVTGQVAWTLDDVFTITKKK